MKHTKFLLAFIVGIFLINLASASIFDAKTFEKNDSMQYGRYVIKEGCIPLTNICFGGTTEIIELKNNQGLSCGRYCSAEFEVHVVKDNIPLIDNIRFLTIKPDGSKIEQPIRSYNFEYADVKDDTWKWVNDYIYTCEQAGVYTNGSAITNCYNKENGKHKEYSHVWMPYFINQPVPNGKYVVRVNGEKKESRIVDWQVSIAGTSFSEEWAVWGSTGLENKLLGYWTFNETSGTLFYDSLGKKNMTLENAHTISGKIAGAYGPTGGTATDNTNAPMAQNGTLNFWINRSGAFTGSYVICSYETATENGAVCLGTNAGGTVTTYYVDTGGNHALTTFTLTTSNWFMITWVVNSSTITQYVDGIINKSASLNSRATTWTSGFQIAADIAGNYKTFPLTFDELSQWNRSLSASEVGTLYSNGSGMSYINITAGVNSITLNSPANLYTTINNQITFSCNATPTSPATLINISLWHNATGTLSINQTQSRTGTTNTSIFNASFPIGNYNWSCSACDSDGDCGVASENRTFSIKETIINLVSYNASTYETLGETYHINASGLLSTANLWFNGTKYVATIVGDVASAGFTQPTSIGNKSIKWELNGKLNSSIYYQNVLPINFSKCDYSLLNVTYLNVTFADEVTSASINETLSGTIQYYLGDGSVTKTYSFSNVTNNQLYPFCFSPPDKTLTNTVLTLQYGGTGYPLRNYADTISLTNASTSLNLKSLATADGIYVTFTTINDALAPISGVSIEITRVDNGATTGILNTDASGSATFFLNPNVAQNIVVTKSGYVPYTTTISPTQTQYTITLAALGSTNASANTASYVIAPLETYLTNRTTYQFNATFNFTGTTISYWGFNITNASGYHFTSASSTSNPGFQAINLNTGNESTLYLRLFWWEGSAESSVTRTYVISNIGGTDWSISNIGVDLKIYIGTGLFGLTTFGLNLIIFFIIFITTGILSWKYGLYSPIAISIIAVFLTGAFTFLGFLDAKVFAIVAIAGIAISLKEGMGY